MENTNTEPKKKRIVPKGKVKMIVQREFIGENQVKDVMLPIIFDDLKTKLQKKQFRTFDSLRGMR